MFNHYARRSFWERYYDLPEAIQEIADKQYQLLEANPRHPSLHFKKVGRFWSARVTDDYRALAIPVEDGFIWFWIGTHAEYEKLI
jgi:hypothetical protein